MHDIETFATIEALTCSICRREIVEGKCSCELGERHKHIELSVSPYSTSPTEFKPFCISLHNRVIPPKVV